MGVAPESREDKGRWGWLLKAGRTRAEMEAAGTKDSPVTRGSCGQDAGPRGLTAPPSSAPEHRSDLKGQCQQGPWSAGHSAGPAVTLLRSQGLMMAEPDIVTPSNGEVRILLGILTCCIFES